jgi:predicted nucleic acid-binding protein
VTLYPGLRAVVVDASVAVPFLNDQAPWPEHWRTWAAADALVLAPAHFPAEVANALLRSARVPAAGVMTALTRLSRSGVETASRGTPGLLDAVNLAERHGLTVYDALYLELALELESELATVDSALRDAAAAEGVPLVG